MMTTRRRKRSGWGMVWVRCGSMAGLAVNRKRGGGRRMGLGEREVTTRKARRGGDGQQARQALGRRRGTFF